MKRNKVNFEFTKDFGSTKKGTVKELKKTFALLLEKEKAGKIRQRMTEKKAEPKTENKKISKVNTK